MPRPRKPTKILELKGAFKKNPSRKRDAEPKPTNTIGPPPKHLNKEQRAVWREIVKIAPPGVIFNSDSIALEILCCLIAEFRANTNMVPARIILITRLLSKFGFTPADRSKVVALPTSPPQRNGWDAL